MITQGLIFDIKHFSVNDGPGIRTTVFFKGCPLSCWWCHNPESRLCEIEEVTLHRRLNGREFARQEAIGRFLTLEEVMAELERDAVFYETSGGGVTFSGGEPLLQPEFLEVLAEECRHRGFHTCLDTSGYCDPRLFERLIPIFDLFLFDIKVLDNDKHILYTGSPVDEVLINLKRLDQSESYYIIRVPVIPGVNDDRRSFEQLLQYLQQLNNPMREIHFLPYHPLAKHKLKILDMEDKMVDSKRIIDSELSKLASEFENAGYKVKIGG